MTEDEIQASIKQAMTPYVLQSQRAYELALELDQIVRGNSRLQLAGMLAELSGVKQQIAALVTAEQKREERDREMRARMTGIVIGLTITGIGSIGSLAALIKLLFGL